MNYLQIVDSRDGRDVIMIWWLAPPMFDETARTSLLVLDQYFVVGFVHGQVNTGGTITYDSSDAPVVTGNDGVPMKLLTSDAIPPTVTGLLAGVQASLGQSIGALGKGIQWDTFTGPARACSKGNISIAYAGETYTYDTPIPGCPKS
jgi:hypothetical protein